MNREILQYTLQLEYIFLVVSMLFHKITVQFMAAK
jgi:hypothetical protein